MYLIYIIDQIHQLLLFYFFWSKIHQLVNIFKKYISLLNKVSSMIEIKRHPFLFVYLIFLFFLSVFLCTWSWGCARVHLSNYNYLLPTYLPCTLFQCSPLSLSLTSRPQPFLSFIYLFIYI
jgi:hypothetical protein